MEEVSATYTLKFRPAELALIASLLGFDAIPVAGDPFSGWSAEEIGSALQQARYSLVERHYIDVRPEGKALVDGGVAALVTVAASPEYTLLITLASAGELVEARYVHFAGDLVVEQANSSAGGYYLTAIRDRSTLMMRLREMLDLSEQPEPNCEPCVLSEKDFEHALEVGRGQGVGACVASLVQAGISPSSARELAETLIEPLAKGMATVVMWDGKQPRVEQTVTWMAGSKGLWLLMAEDAVPGSVNLSPAGSERVLGKIEASLLALPRQDR